MRETKGGVVECHCRRKERLRAFRRVLPPEFRPHNLARLKPRADLHAGQVEIVPYLRENPGESYLFCGRNRVGKSHFGWALLRAALLRGNRTVACNVGELLDEYRAAVAPFDEDRGVCPRPRILSSDLEVPEHRYTLLLQEFDKGHITEFATEKLFNLIDAAFNHHHQLLITSNLSADELIERWSRWGVRYGSGMVSRLLERCVEVNLF